MSILQRCKICRARYSLRASVCRCGEPSPPGRKNLTFYKKIAGKRYFKDIGAQTIDMAQRLYAEWLMEINAPSSQKFEERAWQEIVDAYLMRIRAMGSTYYGNSKLFLSRMTDFWGNPPVTGVTPDLIRRFQAILRAQGMSPAYADRHLAIGKAAWTYSLDLPNPFKRVRFFNPDNTLVRRLTEEQENALLEAIAKKHHNSPPHLATMILLAVRTGMRERDVFRLHQEEVDLETGVIRFKQKRGLTHEVVIAPDLLAALRAVTPNQAGWYFPNPRTGEPYTRMDKSFASLKARAGIKFPFRIHDLRHHFASEILKLTGNIVVVKEALGHRNINTTMKYLSLVPGQVRQAVQELGTKRSLAKDTQKDTHPPVTDDNKLE